MKGAGKFYSRGRSSMSKSTELGKPEVENREDMSTAPYLPSEMENVPKTKRLSCNLFGGNLA